MFEQKRNIDNKKTEFFRRNPIRHKVSKRLYKDVLSI